MPEGDTIHRSAATLRRALVGRGLTRVELPRHRPPIPQPGAAFTDVEARGKHLLMRFDDGLVLHTHMGMTGSWHLYAPGDRWRKSARSARVVLGSEGILAVCFAPQVVEVLDERGARRHPILSALGPDLCLDDVDFDLAVRRMGELFDPGYPVGEVLLDQRVACGVGNVYRCDVLFLHRLHPRTPIGALDDDQRRALLQTASKLLRRNLDLDRRTTMSSRGDGALWVHGRRGKPCRRCGTRIALDRLGEHARFVYWCPRCQARTDDVDGAAPDVAAP